MLSNNQWEKKNPGDKIWWLDTSGETIDDFIFSFDKKKKYNLYQDYPYKLTKEEQKIFKKENPYWAWFFKDREKGGD